MRIVLCLGVAAWLAACSDDTKTPTDMMVPKPEAKAGDGPAVAKEASTADKGPGKDGAATGTPIGAAGGQAKSPDGKFILDIPAGALGATQTFLVSKPATNPPGSLVATWSALANPVVDTAKGTVSADVDHLTCFCSLFKPVEGATVVHDCVAIKVLDPMGVKFNKPAKLTAPIGLPTGPLDEGIYFTNGDCPDTCTNGMKDTTTKETDVDCGGGTCPKCADGKTCGTGTDCTSGTCTAGKCVGSDPCTNKTKDGAETDVDCGGGTCPKCADGKTCAKATDCTSGTCTSGKCGGAAPVCVENGTKDGTETDVDCGGGCPKACASGKLCLQNSDCMSGLACQSATPGMPKTCVTVAP